MIGYIKGMAMEYTTDTVLIDVSNIGYEVHMPNRPDIRMPIGSDLSLFIHTHAREDALMLFGFPTSTEKELFLKLIKVSGIGAKTALGILSTYPPHQLVHTITSKDIRSLCAVKGIGKKAAEKIIVELSDRLFDLSFDQNTPHLPVEDDLVSALMNLGYKRHTIDQTLSNQNFDSDMPFDLKLKESLKQLSK